MQPKILFAVGLILFGLGVPRLVDAVEIAYRLDIKRDVGVLPWYVLVAVGLGLLLWGLRSPMREAGEGWRSVARSWLGPLGTGLAIAALAMAAVLWTAPSVAVQIRDAGAASSGQALSGLFLVSVGVAAILESGRRRRARGAVEPGIRA